VDTPHCTEPEIRSSEAGGCCYVRKGPVAVVSVENVLPDTHDEQVRIPIIVEVSSCRSHHVPGALDSGSGGYIRKAPAPVVVVEPVPMNLVVLLEGWTPSAVDKIDVNVAVPVVVEYGDAPWHRFDLVFLRRRRVLKTEIEPRRFGDVLEDRNNRAVPGDDHSSP
jgi:hypothetical protein